MDHDVHVDAYRQVVARVGELVENAPDAEMEIAVPACPDWTVRQVVAHLAGLAQDWVDGNLASYGSTEWTASQVSRFERQPMPDLLRAWTENAAKFGSLDRAPLGGTPAMWAFGDAVVHEADLRAVLAPGTQVPADSLALGLKAAIARWRAELGNAEVAPLDIVATDMRTWRVGVADETPNTVTTTGYELFRFLFGRRSRVQVEGWEWSCDPAPYLDIGLPYPFGWADSDLAD